jgi:hypothetical protein
MNLRQLITTLPVVLLLALAGCGGDDDSGGGGGGGGGGESGGDPNAVYTDAVRKLDQLKSGKIDAELDTELRLGTTQTINLTEKGAFSDGGGTTLPKFNVDIAVRQSTGQSQQTSAINTGDAFFVKQGTATEYQRQGGPAQVKQLQETYTKEQTELGSGRIPLLALTPSDWARAPKIEGTEQFQGVEVQRVVAELNVPAFLNDLETAKENEIGMGVTLTKNARQLKEPGADVKTKKLVALIGTEDGRIRRITGNVDGDVAGGVKVDFDVTLSELDEPQEISAP